MNRSDKELYPNPSCKRNGRLGLLDIILVGIAKEPPRHNRGYELHRLLGAIFSMELSADEKLGIMETEYGIQIDGRIKEDVSTMCNLSQGILERGITEREARGKAKFILNMHQKGYTIEQIAEGAGMCMEEVGAIIEGKKPVYM